MQTRSQIDEFIERIVREVIRRLHLESNIQTQTTGDHFVSERLITAATIAAIPQKTLSITVAAKAIVTPLARDEARDRGIKIERQRCAISRGTST